jgi:hypothetical protein
MPFRLTYFDASNRIREVLKAIVASDEWARYACTLPSSDYMDGRKPFRRFFDAHEGQDGEDWLGIMEWAVIEEMRLTGAGLTADTNTVIRTIDRLEAHPNIELQR